MHPLARPEPAAADSGAKLHLKLGPQTHGAVAVNDQQQVRSEAGALDAHSSATLRSPAPDIGYRHVIANLPAWRAFGPNLAAAAGMGTPFQLSGPAAP